MMTRYAENLIQYVMANSDKSRTQAIAYLDEFINPLWRLKNDTTQD